MDGTVVTVNLYVTRALSSLIWRFFILQSDSCILLLSSCSQNCLTANTVLKKMWFQQQQFLSLIQTDENAQLTYSFMLDSLAEEADWHCFKMVPTMRLWARCDAWFCSMILSSIFSNIVLTTFSWSASCISRLWNRSSISSNNHKTQFLIIQHNLKLWKLTFICLINILYQCFNHQNMFQSYKILQEN